MTRFSAPPLAHDAAAADAAAAADDDDDKSTTYTATTPPESVASGLDDDPDDDRHLPAIQQPPALPRPHPGRTFMIRDTSSGHVITLRGGDVILSPPDGRASQWECVETAGWLGFRNGVSGAVLGRDFGLRMCCVAGWHQGWERFRLRERGAGSVLLMDHWWSLRPVGVKEVDWVDKLAVIENWEADEMIWDFIEV
ncbi:dynamin family protein [Diplodia corticola]|uniref:Dynamin family protein n=1 Tax=Diplodia corticola TaxID=236234 RepID=A0A1J9QW05_9PEZI|nr:dynamin family protein [Diplodia corticola]OJD32561.1 dynamin family protein [Diplodia corticola]